jgi:hypothetical protein
MKRHKGRAGSTSDVNCARPGQADLFAMQGCAQYVARLLLEVDGSVWKEPAK